MIQPPPWPCPTERAEALPVCHVLLESHPPITCCLPEGHEGPHRDASSTCGSHHPSCGVMCQKPIGHDGPHMAREVTERGWF